MAHSTRLILELRRQNQLGVPVDLITFPAPNKPSEQSRVVFGLCSAASGTTDEQ